MNPIGKWLGAEAPHYVREYRRLFRHLSRIETDADRLAERAVGGNFHFVGAKQAEIVLGLAPEGPFRLVDVGCGSGRAAYALKDVERAEYLGTDVVPGLLDHARKICDRPDWRFLEIDRIAIPAADAWADIILFMSVFTHLTPEEVRAYIAEAMRVLKPGGAVAASYLDRTEKAHVAGFRPRLRHRLSRLIGRDVMLSFTTEDELSQWLRDGGFAVDRAIKDASFGHHVMVGRKV